MSPNSNGKQNLITDLRIHKLRANSLYVILRKEEEGEFTLSFDYQKNMVLPKLPDQTEYYSRELYMFNFTVGSSTTEDNMDCNFMYIWTENVRGKGSNEIVLPVHHRLVNSNLSNVHTIN